jgi:hypothetical protein
VGVQYSHETIVTGAVLPVWKRLGRVVIETKHSTDVESPPPPWDLGQSI